MNLAQYTAQRRATSKYLHRPRSHYRTGHVFEFRENFDKINRELEKGEQRNRKKAVRYIARKMRQVIKRRYGKGNLYEGVGVYDYHDESRVGYRRPAQHAHLLELGTDTRFVKNYRGSGKSKNVGFVKAEPILIELLKTERLKVEQIMSEPWV